MKAVSIKLKKEDFELFPNTPSVLSKIADYEVPRGHSLVIRNDEHALIKITAKEVMTATINSDPFELTVSYTPAKSDVPSQQGYAVAQDNRYEIVDIDPQNKKIKISGPTTASDVQITLYYAIGEGSYQIAIEKPKGNSIEREAIAVGSLYDLNARNLYDRTSAFIMPEMLLRSEWDLLILVDTPANIDLNNDAAVIQIPAAFLDEEATMQLLTMLMQEQEQEQEVE